MGRSIIREDDTGIDIDISSYDDERTGRGNGIEYSFYSRIGDKEVRSTSCIAVVDGTIEDSWIGISWNRIDERTRYISEVESDFFTSIVDDCCDGRDIEMSSLFVIREIEGVDIFPSDISDKLHRSDESESYIIQECIERYPSESISPEPSRERGSIWIVLDS